MQNVEIDKDEIYSFLRTEVLEYYRCMYIFNRKKSLKILRGGKGGMVHQYVRGLLFYLAKSKQLLPLPEYTLSEDYRRRIDLLWTNKEGEQIAAFEVDRTVYPKSISKLSSLNPTCRKFIVSVGSGEYPIPATLLGNTDIECFDLTRVALGIARYF